MSSTWLRKLTGSDEQQAKNRELQARVNELEQERDTLQAHMGELAQQVAALTKEVNLATVRENGLTEAVTAAEQRLTESQKSNKATLLTHKKELRRKVLEAEQRLKEDHEKELSKLSKESEQRLAEARKSGDQAAEAHKQEAQKQLNENQRELSAARQAATQRLEKLTKLDAHRKGLEKKLNEANERLETLTAQQGRERSEQEEKSVQLAGLSAERDQLKSQLQAQTRAAEASRSSRQEAESRAELLVQEWQSSIWLAAHACESIVGERVGLAFELGAAQATRPLPIVARARGNSSEESIKRLEIQLRELGLVVSCEATDTQLSFELVEGLQGDPAVGRWVASYVVECLGQLQCRPLSVESLEEAGRAQSVRWYERKSSRSSSGAVNANRTRPAVAASKVG